jgi:hypothetical protein
MAGYNVIEIRAGRLKDEANLELFLQELRSLFRKVE